AAQLLRRNLSELRAASPPRARHRFPGGPPPERRGRARLHTDAGRGDAGAPRALRSVRRGRASRALQVDEAVRWRGGTRAARLSALGRATTVMQTTRRVVGLGAAFAVVAGTATLILGTTPQAALQTPPIPKAGPLARPRSVEQVGAPRAATLAPIPPRTPQTPPTIALVERLF